MLADAAAGIGDADMELAILRRPSWPILHLPVGAHSVLTTKLLRTLLPDDEA